MNRGQRFIHNPYTSPQKKQKTKKTRVSPAYDGGIKLNILHMVPLSVDNTVSYRYKIYIKVQITIMTQGKV